ncbi:MAG: ATP-dependent DNA ligase, partial [Bryobacteraceae bacterium]|nr:ATP-dependent DNA ligase [Bryobacteraceae bacterium]
MSLPLPLEFAPMEAHPALEIPSGSEWQYEPKWDGFRALCFRDGESVAIRSKAGEDLARYFPEVVEALSELAAEAFVLDGELVVAIEGKADFDALLQRIHPAPTRIRKLAAQTPAQLILFDMLVADTRECLIGRALQVRRLALDAFAREYLKDNDRIRLSPCTADLECAKRWFLEMAGGLDGIIAKQTQAAYEPGSRTAMLKIKNYR